MEEDEGRDADFRLSEDVLDNVNRISEVNIGGSIVSSPSIHDKKIIFGCNDTFVYCLDLDGNKIWSFKTNDIIFSSPTCYKDYVVFGSKDGYFYCLSMNGELKWKFLTQERNACTPLIVDSVVYFRSEDGIFHALSLEDGKELWKFYCPAGMCFMSPSAVNDSIIFGNFSGYLFCLSKDGELLWKLKTGGNIVQTPLIIGEHNKELSSFRKRSLQSFPKDEKAKIIVGSEDGYFRCINAANGKIIWKEYYGYALSSSPVIYNDTIFFGSEDGKMYAIHTDGTKKWAYQTGNRIVPTPICHNGCVYFGSSDHNFYSLDMNDGRLLWRFLTDGEVVNSPVIYNDTVFFGSWDCNLYAISLKDKELIWKFRTAIPRPSYITKPTVVSKEKHEKVKTPDIKFTDTETTRGYQVKSTNYSSFTGEQTNVFYGSSISYKGNAHYKMGKGKYRKD